MKKTITVAIVTIFIIITGTGLLISFYEPYNQYLPNFISGLGSFFGTFLGVIAGIIITYFTQNISDKLKYSQTLKNFHLELEINKEKINEWLSEIEKFRNSVNGDSLHNFFYHFKLSSFIGVTANQLHLSGEAYNVLTSEQFRQLQQTYEEFSAGWEEAINNKINEQKNTFNNARESNLLSEWQRNQKPEVISSIDFLEQKFKTHLNTLKAVSEHIEKQI